MFWDQVAGVYDIFVNVINRKTHKILKEIMSDLIEPDDVVLECACGTGAISIFIVQKCIKMYNDVEKRKIDVKRCTS